jgi:threonine/homoserine/homoserine lactone efflux protein
MGIVLLIVIVVVIGGAVIAFFGWDRYRGSKTSAGGTAAAEPTSEVFVDPTTGERMRVWYNPGSGQREYRPE